MTGCALLVVAMGIAPEVPHARSASAQTLAPGQGEIGLLAPLRYGLSDGIEISTHPLLMLVAPNGALKRQWVTQGALRLATRHAVLYPSGLYSVLARDGTGGILPHETLVPHILALTNEVLVGYHPDSRLSLTGKVGATLAVRLGEENVASIDLPWAYTRQAPHRRGWGLVAGADLALRLHARVDASASVDVFVLGARRGRYGVEHRGTLAWQATEALRLVLGYAAFYQQYPYGTELNLGGSKWPVPFGDVQWRF